MSDPSLSGVLGSSTQTPSAPASATPSSRKAPVSCYQANNVTLGIPSPPPTSRANKLSLDGGPTTPRLPHEARAALFNSVLTHRTWALATLNANPAIDLLTCLERRRTIGFRYAEVTRSIVIRHGAKDGRVPLDNVRWLQSIMKRCELRVLEQEGHSLMASAAVMSSTLSEIAKEWDEWERIARDKEKRKKGGRKNSNNTEVGSACTSPTPEAVTNGVNGFGGMNGNARGAGSGGGGSGGGGAGGGGKAMSLRSFGPISVR